MKVKKQLCIFVTIVYFVVSFTISAVTADGSQLINENFESYKAGDKPKGAFELYGPADANKTAIEDDGGNKVLKISKDSSGPQKEETGVKLHLSSAASGVVTVSYRIKSTITNKFLAAAYMAGDNDKYSFTGGIDQNGNFVSRVNGSNVGHSPYNSGEWANFRIVLDFDAQQYEFYVNDKLQVKTGFRDSTSNVFYLKFYVSDPGASYMVDDIIISSGTGNAAKPFVTPSPTPKAATQPIVSGGEVLNETFENYAIGDSPRGAIEIYGNNTDSKTAVVVNDGGNKVLQITKYTSGKDEAGIKVHMPTPLTGVVTATYKVKTSSTNTFISAAYFAATDDSLSFTGGIDQNGLYASRVNGGNVGTNPYPFGQWVTFKVIMDFNTQKYEFYVDDKFQASADFRDPSAANLSYGRFYVTVQDSSFMLDDIKITTTGSSSEIATPMPASAEVTPSGIDETVLSEDFNQYNAGVKPDSPFEVYGENTVTVVEDSGDKVLKIERPSSASGKQESGVKLHLPSPVSGRVTATYRVKSTTNTYFLAAAYFTSSDGKYSFTGGIDQNGKYVSRVGGANVGTSPYDVGKWVNFKVIMDFSSQQYEFYVNDKLQAKAGFRDPASDLSYAKFYVSDPGAVLFIDNINISAWQGYGQNSSSTETQTLNPIIYPSANFEDVSPDSWAKPYIDALVAKGAINGKSDTMFAPLDKTTRAEMAAIIVRALKLKPLDFRPIYPDVASNDWYAIPVTTAVLREIVPAGLPTFRPNDNITRAEAMEFIINAYKGMTGKALIEIKGIHTTSFNDINNLPVETQSSIKAAAALGIVNGTSTDKFEPYNKLTREQCAKIVAKLCEFVGK